MTMQLDVIRYIATRRPGITARELAEAIHGRPVQPLVNGDCVLLVNRRVLERKKGPSDRAFRYYCTGSASAG